MKWRLKVCPFCGSSARLENNRPDYATAMYIVRCLHGCASTPENETPKKVVDWWNRRHTGPMFKRTTLLTTPK